LAFHSLKQETGESGAEFVDRINAAAMKLEKAGEVVSDAAKLTRLIHPNQGSGSMYHLHHAQHHFKQGVWIVRRHGARWARSRTSSY
jgi:hypothetical protein